MITTEIEVADTSQLDFNNRKLVREVITYRQNRKGKPLKVSKWQGFNSRSPICAPQIVNLCDARYDRRKKLSCQSIINQF